MQSDDVVIIPAFGVKLEDLEELRGTGCILVDTTCGSVLHVWKRVESYARDGFTAVIHGKHFHEETRATSSQVLKHPEGRYLVVRDMEETDLVCGFIRGRGGHVRHPGAVYPQGFRRLRPGARPGTYRGGQPDDHAGLGFAGDRGSAGGSHFGPARSRGASRAIPEL